MSILVIGAGELGFPVLRSLAQRFPSVNDVSSSFLAVVLRPKSINDPSPSKARELAELRSLEIEIIPADIASSSVDDLTLILKPFDTVISCTGFSAGPGIQLKLAQAALQGAIRRYFPWQFGIDYDIIGPDAAGGLFREQCQVRELLRVQNKTKWIIVSTGMFTSFLFEDWFGVVDLKGGKDGKGIVRALGSWENTVTVTQPDDIGTMVAELVMKEELTPKSGIVYTAGDTVSYDRLANLVENALDHSVEKDEWTVPELRKALEIDHDNQIVKYRLVFSEGRGVAWERAKTINQKLNIPTTDVENWLKNNLEQKLHAS
ncbi:MAG: hypothetical protein Q9190_004654 [Brigantiaea leucoxantha]